MWWEKILNLDEHLMRAFILTGLAMNAFGIINIVSSNSQKWLMVIVITLFLVLALLQVLGYF